MAANPERFQGGNRVRPVHFRGLFDSNSNQRERFWTIRLPRAVDQGTDERFRAALSHTAPPRFETGDRGSPDPIPLLATGQSESGYSDRRVRGPRPITPGDSSHADPNRGKRTNGA